MTELKIREISKSFDGRKVLRNVNAIFPAGSITCLLGPSGYGKTTLLRIVAGLEKPDTGSVEGVPEEIGFVFQEDRLCEDFSAISNVRLVTGRSMPKEEIIRHLTEIGLGDSLDRPVHEYSGGMKRRVAIVRAVCYPAQLLILDEPFKGLDEKLRLEVIDYIRKYTGGKTVICVTHDPDDAERFGGKNMEMEQISE